MECGYRIRLNLTQRGGPTGACRLPLPIAGGDVELLQRRFRLNCLRMCVRKISSLTLASITTNMQSTYSKSIESYIEQGEISLDLEELVPPVVSTSEDFVLDLDLEEIIENSR